MKYARWGEMEPNLLKNCDFSRCKWSDHVLRDIFGSTKLLLHQSTHSDLSNDGFKNIFGQTGEAVCSREVWSFRWNHSMFCYIQQICSKICINLVKSHSHLKMAREQKICKILPYMHECASKVLLGVSKNKSFGKK